MPLGLGIGIGFVSGLLAGFMGVGGAIILIPALVLLGGVEQHLAQGVSLAVVVITALVAALTHYTQGTIRLPLALGIAPTAVLFAFLGAHLAARVDALWLSRVFALLLLFSGINMALRGGSA